MKGNKYIRNIKLHQLGIDVDKKYIEIYNFLEDNLKGLREFHNDKYPNNLYYGKGGNNIVIKWYNFKLCESVDNTLWIHYDKIWAVFEMKYYMQYNDIKKLLIWYISSEFNMNMNTNNNTTIAYY